MEIRNITCANYTSRLTWRLCEYHKEATSQYRVNVGFELDRDLNEDAEVHVLIFARIANTKKAIQFLNFKMKLCKALTESMTSPLTKQIMAEIRKTGNVPYSCPLKGVNNAFGFTFTYIYRFILYVTFVFQ